MWNKIVQSVYTRHLSSTKRVGKPQKMWQKTPHRKNLDCPQGRETFFWGLWQFPLELFSLIDSSLLFWLIPDIWIGLIPPSLSLKKEQQSNLNPIFSSRSSIKLSVSPAFDERVPFSTPFCFQPLSIPVSTTPDTLSALSVLFGIVEKLRQELSREPLCAHKSLFGSSWILLGLSWRGKGLGH